MLVLFIIGLVLAFEDGEDIIFQIKGFFDQYVDSLKNKMKSVEKVITNNSTEYIEDFNLNDFVGSVNQYEEDIQAMMEMNLKDLRVDKQQLDEKVIDYETKIKILRSRFTRVQAELNKISTDLNGKNHTMLTVTNDISNDLKAVQTSLTNSLGMINSLKDYIQQFNHSKLI
jgi:chromosome segregation ATPase